MLLISKEMFGQLLNDEQEIEEIKKAKGEKQILNCHRFKILPAC